MLHLDTRHDTKFRSVASSLAAIHFGDEWSAHQARRTEGHVKVITCSDRASTPARFLLVYFANFSLGSGHMPILAVFV